MIAGEKWHCVIFDFVICTTIVAIVIASIVDYVNKRLKEDFRSKSIELLVHGATDLSILFLNSVYILQVALFNKIQPMGTSLIPAMPNLYAIVRKSV